MSPYHSYSRLSLFYYLPPRVSAAYQARLSDTRHAHKLGTNRRPPPSSPPPNLDVTGPTRLRCIASDVSADLHEQGELLDGKNRQISGDAYSTEHPANGSLGDTLGSTTGALAAVEQGEVEVDMKSPVSVVQEYDRKKKLAGDLGNGFVRFNLSPAKVGAGRACALASGTL